MYRILRTIRDLLVLLVFTSVLGCEDDGPCQICYETETIELQNGLDLVVTKISYGLNGQHERMIFSKDAVQELEVEPSKFPVFSGYTVTLLLDTVPSAILYTIYEPKNMEAFGQFDGKLIVKKLGGSDLYHLSKSDNPKLIHLTY